MTGDVPIAYSVALATFVEVADHARVDELRRVATVLYGVADEARTQGMTREGAIVDAVTRLVIAALHGAIARDAAGADDELARLLAVDSESPE